MSEQGIPSALIAAVIEEWKRQHGPTYPLYGNNTVRHDISGSVRPLLSSTEIPHERILAESSGVSKKVIGKIVSGEILEVSYETCDRLLTAMNRADIWYNELDDYR